jgi:pimeloyl-ACP methyl ester carboxylesterase
MVVIPDPVDLLIGHSWGGAIAILGGRRFDVKRVVAVDPMIRQADNAWYDEFLADLRSLFSAKGAARDARVAHEYRELGWGEIDVERKKHAVREMTIVPIERLRDENPPESWDLRVDLEDYPKPLLLTMASVGESIVPIEDLKFVRERGGPNVAIRVFEDQGHNLHRTAFDRFAQELDRFIERKKESPDRSELPFSSS